MIENAAALGRVVDYIHLNPVRAKIVIAEQVGSFRWSSLRRYLKGERAQSLAASGWLEAMGLSDTPEGWRIYIERLVALSGDAAAQEAMGFQTMSTDWAIGTAGWRKAIAADHAHLALSPGLTGAELSEMKKSRWENTLIAALNEAGKTTTDVMQDPKSAPWKIEIARQLRRAGASCPWIAEALQMGSAGSLRVYLCRRRSINK